MKETLICTLDKHCIYYFSDAYCSFYMSVPTKEYTDTNISFRLKSNYEAFDLNKNPIDVVTNEVASYYNNLDSCNITLILPVFYNGILSSAKNVSNEELFVTIDRYIGHMLNNAYAFLTRHNIKVDDNIFVIENKSFDNFTNWYINRYQSRVQYKTLGDLVRENGSFEEIETIKTPNIDFVVGKNAEPEITKTAEIEVETFDSYVRKLDENKPKTRVKTADNAGFVSYVLLAIVTFGVSILLLTALIK